MLAVRYADGTSEEWPLTEETARRESRRACALSEQRATFLFRRLQARPFWPIDHATGAPIARVCAELEAAYPQLRQEVAALLTTSLLGDDLDDDEAPSWSASAEGLHRGVWQKLEFWSGGAQNDPHRASLPVATALLQRLASAAESPLMLHAPGCAYLSLMMPGTRVAAHAGPTNHRLRLHLPLLVPAHGRPTMRVAGRAHCWRAGECVVFDDSFLHEVDFPETQRPAAAAGDAGGGDRGASELLAQLRVLLVVDLWHPQCRWRPAGTNPF